jgi:predicted ATPase
MLTAVADSPPNNLPNFLTSFIGRETDIARVKQEISTARLLTLTGPGGCGKSRLALKVAAELLAEFRDGAWWCDLAAVTDPAHMAQTIRSALRLAEQADRSALDSLTSALGSQQALLVLDNCEHLLAGCAALGLAVLHACPGVRILATSLQPLGLPLERVWPVPPLALPEPAEDDLGAAFEHDAIRLFVERAARALPSFRLTAVNRRAVIAICRQLDGLPLAIELAAARARLLTVDQIAARLDDAFCLLTRGSLSSLPRHQTFWHGCPLP